MRLGRYLNLLNLSLVPLSACTSPEADLGWPCSALVPGDLVITEIMADPDGVDTGKEYVEIYNATEETLALEGLTLYHTATDGQDESRVVLSQGVIPSRGYIALGDARTPPWPAHVHESYGQRLGALRNGGGKIGLRCGDTILNEVVYPQAKVGHAYELDGALVPDGVQNQNGTLLCLSRSPLDTLSPKGKHFGTPGLHNQPCAAPATEKCEDSKTRVLRAIRSPKPGELRTTEMMPHPGNVPDASGEWFEIVALAEVDLNGVELGNEGLGRTLLTFPTCKSLAKGERAVFARSTDPVKNGGLPEVAAAFSFALANTGPRAVVLRHDGTEIDRAEYDGAKKGISWQLASDQLDGASVRLAAGSDSEGPKWCATPAEASYGRGDRGTPGAPNLPCPRNTSTNLDDPAGTESTPAPEPPPEGTCRDLQDGTLRAVRPPTRSQLIINEIMRAPTTANGGAGEWFELRAQAEFDLNGVEIGNEGSGLLRLASPDCLHVAAGDLLLFARGVDPATNGGLPTVFARFAFALADGATANVPARALIIRSNGQELDRLTWTHSTRGVAEQRAPFAPGVDSPPTWCLAPANTTFGQGDRGSPGLENPPCP